MYKQELEYNPNYTENISRACQPELNEVSKFLCSKRNYEQRKINSLQNWRKIIVQLHFTQEVNIHNGL